jgi:hypothetical protein
MDKLYIEVFELRKTIQDVILPKLIEIESVIQKKCNSKPVHDSYMDLDKYYKNYPRT